MKRILLLLFVLFGLFVLSLLFLRSSNSFLSPLTKSIEQSPFFTPSIPIYIPSSPTLDQVFSTDKAWIATLSASRRRVLIATGDVIPARVVNIQATKREDFLWPFAKTADILKQGDITFIDLETPLTKNCPLINDGFKFCGDERHINGLLSSGVDVASIGNNHAGNYGIDGVKNTIELLKSKDILVTGTDGPVYTDVRGITFAFLGYNDIGYKEEGISWADTELIKKEIFDSRKKADVVVVGVHWGVEYVSQPSERQKELAHLFIDSGADVVIGNHPHWIQPIELYKDKFISYAHGNFVFDQEWSKETKEGVVGKYTFYDDDLIDVEFLPIFIQDWGQPSFLSGKDKTALLEAMKKESLLLANSK